MQQFIAPHGVTVSYKTSGEGPPLVLVHGSFSDHDSNWALVRPLLDRDFSVYAVARRGRGGTDGTEGHGVEDEGRDIAAVIEFLDEPLFLLGHSYGAQVALAAAEGVSERIRGLILYEPPAPGIHDRTALQRLEGLAAQGRWDAFAATFFGDVLDVPAEGVEGLRASDFWPSIVADAPASLGDIRALTRYAPGPARFRSLRVPTLLQVGTESPRHCFITDELMATLPDARVEAFQGEAHEAMITAPALYAESVSRFLTGCA